MKTVFSYLLPYRLRMALGLCVKVTATLSELLLPYILSHILKNVVAAGALSGILWWGAAMIVFSAVAMVLNVVANRMAAGVARDFAQRLRMDLFSRTLGLSAAQTDAFTLPSLESRITTDTYHVHQFVNMIQRLGIRAPILLVGGIAITLVMDAYLSLVMIAILPLIFATVYLISRRGVPLYVRVQESVDSMIRVVRENAQGIRVIKALSKNDYENRRYDRVNRTLSHDERVAGTVMGVVNPVMNLLMNCGITAVVALSAQRVVGHRSDPETVIAFMQYFHLISMAMMSVSRMFVMYTKCAASSERIAQVLNAPEDPVEIPLESIPHPNAPQVEFENVSFSYTGGHRHLQDVSFSLRQGERLGIIGSTGAGKTTLIKLLMRFYDATEGRIRIHGRDVRTYPHKELTELFGVVLQNDFLYADTVEENIRFGRSLTSEEIRRAAELAQADDFIRGFTEGYAHPLAQKGSNLSGGQKQRLLIARALAANPSILVLDDSSSALDYKTDANLRLALRENLRSTTVITVAQRVSSVKDCDLILVLEEGRVIGRGTHEELLASCPTYREISDSQMGGAFLE
ncbi:MAG: ABC transporter ATP-binding protein [Ruminococcaceae bacterium]|nr:ABC transporter ATP-binding protein [Oscillospiraceae bacterium]